MDISETLAPASDQLDGFELAPGPRVFEIAGVSKGSAEQPVNVALVDFPRPWRPGKSMRRVLAFCWGTDASKWVGRRVELYFDPDVTFGKEKPGGTRIRSLSHIDGPKQIPLLVSRGRSAVFTVQPLTEPVEPPPLMLDNPADVMTREQSAQLKTAFDTAGLTDTKSKLNYVIEVIGRPITTSAELTRAEAGDVIDALEQETHA